MNVPKLHIVAETSDTVTLRRDELDRLVAAFEDALDHASVRALDAEMAARGWEAVCGDMLTVDEAERLWAGEHPVRVWRERRALTQRALAEAADVPQSYISELESGVKPGSVSALVKLSAALRVRVDDLIPEPANTPG